MIGAACASISWDDPVVTPPAVALNEWSGPYIGVGADWRVNDSVVFGAKYAVAEMQDYDVERAELRVAFN